MPGWYCHMCVLQLKRKAKEKRMKLRVPESLINASRAHMGDEWVSVDMGDTFLQVGLAGL